MKEAWKTLTVLMIASPCYVLADANTPTDDVVNCLLYTSDAADE